MEVLDNRCPSCGAKIDFDPKTQTWKCDYCGGKFTLEEMKKHSNASSEKANQDSKTKKTKVTSEEIVNMDIYTCKNCGAEIVTDEQTTATFCVYCGSTAILKGKMNGEFKPNYLIPFKIEKEKAIKAFKEINKGRPFVPKNFNDQKNIEKIRGVYIPFWLYDVKGEGSLNLKGTIVTQWSNGDIHYTNTKYYDICRTGELTYTKIPVDGSTRFDNDIMNSIEPFNYEDLIPYNHAYLSGFLAEKYDVNSEEASLDSLKRAKNSTYETFRKSCIGYTTLIDKENTLTNSIISSNYVLLPVWMVNVKYNNKLYIFAMNGQTGKFIGNIPLDKKKMILFFLSAFIICLIIIILLSWIGYKVF